MTTTSRLPVPAPVPPRAYLIYNPRAVLEQRDRESDFLAAVEPAEADEHRKGSRALAVMVGMIESARVMAGMPTEASGRGFRAACSREGLR